MWRTNRPGSLFIVFTVSPTDGVSLPQHSEMEKYGAGVKGKWENFVTGSVGQKQPGYPQPREVTDYCPMNDGLWIISGTHINKVPWNNLDSIPDDKLIAQLSAENFDARETATDALIRRGAAVSEQLHKALLASQNNEAKYRIEHILSQLQPQTTYTQTDTRLKCGRFVIEEPLFILTLSDGSLLIGAMSLTDDHGESVTPKPAHPTFEEPRTNGQPPRATHTAPGGVVRITPSGETTLLGGEDLIALFIGTHNIQNVNVYANGGCYVAPDAKSLWFRTMGFQFIAGVNIATGKISKYEIGGGARQIQAMGTDGRVFIGGGMGPLVLNPSAEDKRTPIAPVAIVGQGQAMFGACSRDGTMWFNTEQGASYFDGRQLQPIPGSNVMGRGMFMSPGNDCVLAQHLSRAAIITKQNVISEDLVQDLVAKNAAFIAKSFSKSLPSMQRENVSYLHGDSSGNVWVFANQRLRAFSTITNGSTSLPTAAGEGGSTRTDITNFAARRQFTHVNC